MITARLSIMSVCSIALLLFCQIFGEIEMHSVAVGLGFASGSFVVTIDPAYIVWTDYDLFDWPWRGATFGNIMILPHEGKERNTCSIAEHYEFNHVLQFRALGWAIYPAQLFVDIEAPDMCSPDLEWTPPETWTDLWHFFSIEIGPSVHSRNSLFQVF